LSEESNKRIKELYGNLLNKENQKKIMNFIIEGKEPSEIIEQFISELKEEKNAD
jgi:hypothetical protein